MTTYPLPTLACTIDATGISSPAYSDIFASLQASFQALYGSDSYIDDDSEDGQMLAIFAQLEADKEAAIKEEDRLKLRWKTRREWALFFFAAAAAVSGFAAWIWPHIK